MATATLAEYPEQIVRLVCYSLPQSSKWLPSIAEIREACDRAMGRDAAQLRRERERAHTAQVLAGAKAAVEPRVVDGFARLAETLPQPAQPTRVDLDQLAREYAARPVMLSPAALKAAGLEPN